MGQRGLTGILLLMIHKQFFAQNRNGFTPVVYSEYTFNDTGEVPFSGTRPIVSFPTNNGVFIAYSDGYNYGDGYIQWAHSVNLVTGEMTIGPRFSLSSTPVNSIDVIKEEVGEVDNTYFYVTTLEYTPTGSKYVKLYAIAERYEGSSPVEETKTVSTFSSEENPHICIAGDSAIVWVFYGGGYTIYTMDMSLTFIRAGILSIGTYKKAIAIDVLDCAVVYQDGSDIYLKILHYNVSTLSVSTLSTTFIGSYTLSNEFQNIVLKLVGDKLLVILDSSITYVVLIDISDTSSPAVLQTKSYSDYIFNSMDIDSVDPNTLFWTYSSGGVQKIRRILINSSTMNISLPIDLSISAGCNSIRMFGGYGKGVLCYEDNDDYSSGKVRLISL